MIGSLATLEMHRSSSMLMPLIGYLQREISEVLQVADEHPEDSIFVIPARLEPCDVPERFRRWQWVDLFEELAMID
jgi:hypothetical protein